MPALNSSQKITLPARNSVGPGSNIPFPREPKARREALAAQLPLQEGRKVAFHPPNGSGTNGPTDESTWILAVVTSQDKNRLVPSTLIIATILNLGGTTAMWYRMRSHRKTVSPGREYRSLLVATCRPDTPRRVYTTTLRSIIPLPDPTALPNSASHQSAYPVFPVGATVMALYPDTSCFYRAEVLASPNDMHPPGRVSQFYPYEANDPHHIDPKRTQGAQSRPMYKLKFEDDGDQEHSVSAQLVVEWPG